MNINFEKMNFECAFGTSDQLIQSDRPEIVFSGRSNVGKSTLLNKLCSQKSLARVSSTPGKTTTINFFTDGEVRLVDLPGYGYAKRSDGEKLRWASLMEFYFNSGRNIPLAVQLVDSRREPTEDDYDMMHFMHEGNIDFIVVMTKFDKLNVREQVERTESIRVELEQYPNTKIIPFSSLKNIGIDEIKGILRNK